MSPRPARVVLQAAAQLSSPLPECPGCDRPVRREVARRNGGLCSGCAVQSPAALFDATARSKGTPHSAR